MRLNHTLRFIAESLSRGLVLKRRLPAKFGGARVYVSPEARLSYWRRDVTKSDPALLELAREFVKPGDVVWDVGANVGLFAVAAAYFAGSAGAVYAFEPDTWLASLIGRTAAAQPPGRAPIHMVAVALSDRVGTAQFHIAKRRAGNSLETDAAHASGGFTATQVVPTFTMDALLQELPPPRVIKIDVESAEHRVFKGAEKLLREVKPILISETTERHAEWDSNWLSGFGYSFYDADLPQGLRRRLQRVTYNTLALPPASSGSS